MTTRRLDALLNTAVLAADTLWLAIASPGEWERWRLSFDLAGADYIAIPFGPERVPVLATMRPPNSDAMEFRPAEAVNRMRDLMMAAFAAGWPATPAFSERLATTIDVAEEVMLRHGPMPWTWPAAPTAT